jgi:glycine dehydrogenase subunit 1
MIQLPTFEAVFDQPFFNEFVVKTTLDVKTIQQTLIEAGIVGGIDLGQFDSNLRNHLLFAVTEKRTKAEIDQLISVLGGINHESL